MKTESDGWEYPGSLILSRRVPIESERRGMKGTETLETARAAFWALLEPLKTGLYNFILKALAFSTEADDVYQETLLDAFRYFGAFRGDAEFKPWIYAIAHNKIKRHFKKSGRQNGVFRLDLPASSAPDESVERVREIFRHAAGLKPKEREVFFLYYESGFSLAEIEDITGLKEGYSKLLLNQARTRLKKKLGVRHE